MSAIDISVAPIIVLKKLIISDVPAASPERRGTLSIPNPRASLSIRGNLFGLGCGQFPKWNVLISTEILLFNRIFVCALSSSR
jgi:hypothetical protein